MLRQKDIENEIIFLEETIQKVSSELEILLTQIPKGARLRSARHGNEYQYFMRSSKTNTSGIYIRKKDRKQASILAQIEYDEKLLMQLQDALPKLKLLEINCAENLFEATLSELASGKGELVTLPYVSDERYILNWKSWNYTGLEFNKDYPEYYTRQGLRVRSKSEVIIADILDETGIPFLYEKPLRLKTGLVHPDFTLLNIKSRREVYWEHLGMMDDMDYRNNAFMKLRSYEASGLYPYESVIWTFETGKYPLNTKEIRKMVKNLKQELGYK